MSLRHPGASLRLVAALLLILPSLAAQARPGGAGGILLGLERPAYAPSFLPSTGSEGRVEELGGFGYGLDREGFIVGGFGSALLDQVLLVPDASREGALVGGIGGMLLGQRLVDGRRLDLDLGLRIGLGGLARARGSGWEGWAVALAEPYAELLVAVSPWMALSGRLGYRLLGNFVPGYAFQDLLVRTPVLGFSISWGSFR